ncbi:MAG: HAMP domain-containing protein [Oceanospirillaceae bacterium]|nr:HAMP domain-containing protein [Oceanospirillaceae bacterium]
MFTRIYHLKVRQKLFILLISGLIIMLSCALAGSVWLALSQPTPNQILQPLINTYHTNSHSPARWIEYLNEAQSEFNISDVSIYSMQGKLIASSRSHVPENIHEDNSSILQQSLLVTPQGILLINSKRRWLEAIGSLGLIVFSALMISGLGLIYLSLMLLDYLITRPIRKLNHTMTLISQTSDFKIRARQYYRDEIGTLAKNFNSMLDIIETHSRQISTESKKANASKQRAIELSKKMHEMNEKLSTEIKQRISAEQDISDLQQYLNNIIESMPSAIIAIDAGIHIIQCNSAAQELFNVQADVALQKPLQTICSHLQEYYEPIRYSVDDQQLLKIERIKLHSDNTTRLFDLTIYPLKNSENPGAVIRIDDVSQQVRMEEVLVQNEKMMSLGGLAAGMAHEINNPLGAIIHTLQNMNRRLDQKLPKNIETALAVGTDIGSIRAYLSERGIFSFIDNIREAGERASQIVSNMLQFSRQSHKDLHPQDIHQIIERALSIASNDYNMTTGYDFKRIELLKDFEFNLPLVPCIPSEIEQVIINILKNAAQALNEYGNQKEFDMDWFARIEIHTYLEHGQAVIEIADNGPGMDEETRKHIFEPFFTTKDVGAGTGLGLSVSYFIMTSHHNGAMQVSSQLGQGSIFTLSLPLQSNP